jgi:hypothetical protein
MSKGGYGGFGHLANDKHKLLDVDDATAGEQDKDQDQQQDDVEGTLANDGGCCQYQDQQDNDCDE